VQVAPNREPDGWAHGQRLAIPQRPRWRYRAREEVFALGDFFKVVSAGPMFFVSTWVLMVFIGIASKNLGIHPIGYGTSMVVTIGLWLAVAPAIGAVSRVPGRRSRHG